MSRRTTTFEIYVEAEGRATLNATTTAEKDALERARSLVARLGPKADVVRVVKEVTNQAGATFQSEVFRHVIVKPKKPADIAMVDNSAPVCDSYEALMRVEARTICRRILKPWLDQNHVTPLELSHLLPVLKRLMDVGTVFQAAVGRVAMLQAKSNGEPARKNMAQLFDLTDQLRRRVSRADQLKGMFPDPTPDNFDDLHRMVDEAIAEADRAFIRRTLTARLLSRYRTDSAKADAVLGLVEVSRDRRTQLLCDHALADLFLSADIIQECFGAHASLGSFLAQVCQLLSGQLDLARLDPMAMLARLDSVHRRVGLIQMSDVLIERVIRELNGRNPLDRKEPEKERLWISTIAKAAAGRNGQVIGGPALVRALHHRRAYALARAEQAAGLPVSGAVDRPGEASAMLKQLITG